MTPVVDIGLDFDSAERTTKPAPESDYDLQVAKSELGETGPNSKNPGSPMLKLVLEIVGNSDPLMNGKRIFHNVTLPGRGGENAQFIVNTFKAFGLRWTGSSFDTDIFLGRSCKGKVTIEEYNGAYSNKIAKLY